MFKVLVVGLPAAYVTGVVAFGGVYLTAYGSWDMMNAIAYGIRWPVYLPYLLG
jgi:hypothetical protein